VADHSAWDNAWIANTSWYKQDGNGNIISPSGFNDVAAFNFNSGPMRLAQISAMKYWILTANIDGYRCDDADGPPADFWTQAIDTLNKFTNRRLVLFAEGSQSAQFTAGFQMNNAFSFYSSLKSIFGGGTPASLFSTNLTENGTVPTGSFKIRYSTNHDDTSSDGSEITIYGGTQGATAAFVLSAYMSGVPEIYNGQEVGNAVKINFFNNTAIDWTINPAMTAEFKRIISIRANHEAIKTGNLTSYVDANVVAFEKVLGADDVLVLVNVRNTANTFSLPAGLQNSTWINAETKANITLSTSVTLQAYNYLILSKN
jgi:glycosidase